MARTAKTAISAHLHFVIFIVRTFFSYLPGHERREYDPSVPVSLPTLRTGGVGVRKRVEGCRMMPSVRGGNLFASAAKRGQIDK